MSPAATSTKRAGQRGKSSRCVSYRAKTAASIATPSVSPTTAYLDECDSVLGRA